MPVSYQRLLLLTLLLTTAHATPSLADWRGAQPDGHAPIGVMGDHLHQAREWMVSYRFAFMAMKGNRTGTTEVSAAEVRDQGYPVVPTAMSRHVHMLGLMHGASDAVTVMAMLPLVYSHMEHKAGDPLGTASFDTQALALGDMRWLALLRLMDTDVHHLHGQLGLSLPTGAIHVRDATPQDADARLPYPMRTGSGSFEALPALTYRGFIDWFSWGAQVAGSFPLHRNVDDYRRGLQGTGSAWFAVRWNRWVSTSLRAQGTVQGNYAGADPDLNPAMVPTADPNLRGLRRVEVFAGANLLVAEGPLVGHRLALELGIPAYQHLDGPQLEQDWRLVAGWQWSWDSR